jgi:hypothetical protein
MSILLFGEVKEQRSKLSPEMNASNSVIETIWSGQWYFAKNQINSKEFLYRRISDSVPKNIIEYVSFTSSTSHPKPRGRKKMRTREEVVIVPQPSRLIPHYTNLPSHEQRRK